MRLYTDSKTILPSQISIPTTHRQSPNTRVVHRSPYSSETVLRGFDVDVFPCCATLSCDGHSRRVNSDFAHRGEVDDEPVGDGGGPGCGVPATTDGEGDVVCADEGEGAGDVGVGGDFYDGGLVGLGRELDSSRRG